MTSKLKQTFEQCENKPVAFVIKGSPDPDAIASSLALLSYYQSIGGSGTIYHEDYVSHSSNKAMINILDIQMTECPLKDIQEEFYVICDHCDPFIADCEAECILHIDHHKTEAPDDEIKFTQYVEYDAGSCSSIITRLLQEQDFFNTSSNIGSLATALVYGIKTDTDNLDGAREKDWDAMKVLSHYQNRDDLRKITSQKISPQAAEILRTAMANEKQDQSWLYASVGSLQESYRDAIAQVADEFNRRQGADYILIYGIIEKKDGPVVEGSVRSADAGFDMEGFVKRFSENSGGRKFKGGFQIPLGFWGGCPDKSKLDDFVITCIEEKITSILNTTSTKLVKKKKEKIND